MSDKKFNENISKKRQNNSKVSFSNENIYIDDEQDQYQSFKKSLSIRKQYHSNEYILNKTQKNSISRNTSAISLDNFISLDNNLKKSNSIESIIQKSDNSLGNSSTRYTLINQTRNKSNQNLNKSRDNISKSNRQFLTKKQNINTFVKPKENIPKKVAKSKNGLSHTAKNGSLSSLNKSNDSLSSLRRLNSSREIIRTKPTLNENKRQLKIKNLTKSNSTISLNNTSASCDSKIGSNISSLNGINHKNQKVKKRSKSNEKCKVKTNEMFIDEWKNQKILFKNIHIALLVIDILLTLSNMGIAVWINIDQRFIFISNISNQLSYSSMYRLIGLLPYLFLSTSCVSFLVDISRIFFLIYVKNFLYSHDDVKLKKIIENQQILLSLSNDIRKQNKHLRLRVKINHYLKMVLRSVKSIFYMSLLIYIVIIAFFYFMGLYLHFKLNYVLSYQLPQTLLKLIREYEKQIMSALGLMNIIVKIKSVAINTLEERLINKMHIEFFCCNYQNPFQYGDYAPSSCNYERGCLNPVQDFLWDYLFIGVIYLLGIASLKICIQFLTFINFRIILIRRLIYKLYNFDVKKYESNFIKSNEQLNIIDQLDSDSSESDLDEKKRKLEEVRRKKEEILALEDEEEEMERIKRECEFNANKQQEKIQLRYEEMLRRQNRFEELKFQQRQRQIQMQHLIDSEHVE